MQPRYEAAGLITFPVAFRDKDKVPAIKHWQKIGLSYSRKLASNPKFENAGIGLCCGKRSGLTILDYDALDEEGFTDALKRHGDLSIRVKRARFTKIFYPGNFTPAQIPDRFFQPW